MAIVGIDHVTHVELVEDDSRLCKNYGHNHWHYASPDGDIHCRTYGCECIDFEPHPHRRFKSLLFD